MKKLFDYADKYGVIGQRVKVTPSPEHPDGIWIETGDGMQRSGMIMIAEHFGYQLPAPLLNKHEAATHELKDGVFRRGADKRYWYSDPRNCSRDQMTSFIIGCGFKNQAGAIKRSLWANIKRFGFYQNTQHNWEPQWQYGYACWEKGTKIPDIMTPEFFASYLRAYWCTSNCFPLLYILFFPFLIIGDIFGFFATLFKVFHSHMNTEHSDDLTRMCLLVQADQTPTPISFVNVWLYKYRHGGPQYALDKYFGTEAAPPINEIWKRVVEEVWG